ncbi:MAG TPA: hypothetical protein VMH87_04935 [Pseudomonadales bacterium]|nr:hypothetical protein [Pseudomonadales bacterium]
MLLLTLLPGIFLASFASSLAQGTLTPPGAPGPTMKTLSQLEPRVPISSAPYIITQPGSYYLTTNVTVNGANGITITTNGVTLDLGGFTISSTATGGGGYGIYINTDLRNITIANGFIQGGVTNNGSGVYSGNGFYYGIYCPLNRPVNTLLSHLSISGCLFYGIYLDFGDSTVVEACTVRTVGAYGIVASTIKQSSAMDCGGSAIYGDQVSDCRGQCTSGSSGVTGLVVQNCYGYSSSGTGLAAYSCAINCEGYSLNGAGLYAFTAENCFGYSTSSTAITGYTALNCFGNSAGSGAGINDTLAQNCYGMSGSGTAVNANVAQNCYGTCNSGYGIYAFNTAENCTGYNNGSGYGIYTGYIANGCFGYCNSGTGISAYIANICHGASSSGTALSATHNVNSF